jgi:hypothetical protein
MHQPNASGRRSTDVAPATPVLDPREDPRNIVYRDALTRWLLSEFREIPGLCLTPVDAAPVFRLTPYVCQRVLSALVEDGMLVLRADGRYRHRASSM